MSTAAEFLRDTFKDFDILTKNFAFFAVFRQFSDQRDGLEVRQRLE
jgi:hypothetical protein